MTTTSVGLAQLVVGTLAVPKPLPAAWTVKAVTSSEVGRRVWEAWTDLKASVGAGGASALAVVGLVAALAPWGLALKVRKGRVALFVPFFVYDLVAHALYLPNYVICAACYWQPAVFLQRDKSEWNEGDRATAKETLAALPNRPSVEAVKQDILARKDVAYDEVDLVRVFDTLPTIPAAQMTGKTYHGKILRTNKSVLDLPEWAIIRPLSLLGFGWGKRYRTQHTGDPLLFNWLRTFYFPLPLWGNVSMLDIGWRGAPTATMNYDNLPWKDYFRVLSRSADGKLVLLGVWTSKDKAGGWFTLTLDEDIPT